MDIVNIVIPGYLFITYVVVLGIMFSAREELKMACSRNPTKYGTHWFEFFIVLFIVLAPITIWFIVHWALTND